MKPEGSFRVIMLFLEGCYIFLGDMILAVEIAMKKIEDLATKEVLSKSDKEDGKDD